MDIPSDDDAWGEFKSTPEQSDSVGDGVLPTTAGSASDCERDEPPPSVAGKQQQRQQPEAAEEPESAAGGGKEDEHASAETTASAQPSMPHSAAELGESNETVQMTVVDVKAARPPDQKKQQPPQQCRDDDNNSGSGLDLLDLLPSPTTTGGGMSTGGENLDMFVSMLASAPENPVHKLSAAAAVPAEASHQGDPADRLKGASASSKGEKGDGGEDEGEWGVFELPEAEERDPTPAPAATPATPTLAAEKVDGEWIDLVQPGLHQPGEGKEGYATAADDEKNGVEGTVAVGRVEHEPHLDAQQQQQHQQADEYVVDILGCDIKGSGLLVESDASGSATKAIAANSPTADEKPDVKPAEQEDEEPHPSDRGAEEEIDPPSAGPGEETPPEADSNTHTLPEPESWAAAATPQTAGSGSLGDIADFSAGTATTVAVEDDVPGDSAGVAMAVSAAEPSELEPSLPSGTVAGKLEGESGEGSVAGADEGGSPSAAPEAAGIAPVDILVWGDFGGLNSASADEATVDGAPAATSENVDENVQGGQAKEDEEPSRSGTLGATGVPAMDILGLGDFGGPASTAETVAVGGAAAASSEGMDGKEQEGQAKEGQESSHSAVADEAVADVFDWGDFGGPTSSSAVEVTADGAAAASSESVDVFEQDGQATEDEELGHSAAPDATGVAAADTLDGGDFGGSTSAVEATVDGSAAISSESTNAFEQEDQAKEVEEPSHPTAPDATRVAVADALDWGDFGASTSADETTAREAAAASSETVDGDEQEGQAKEDEVPGEAEDDDEWSAFEAPPKPSAAQNQDLLEPPPRAANEKILSVDFAPPAAGMDVQEESKDEWPDSPTPTTAKGAGGSEGLATAEVGEAGDTVRGEHQQTSSAAIVPPHAAPAVEWGGFGEEEPSEPSPEEPPVGRTDVDHETLPRDDEQALPAAMPELGGIAGEDGSSSWGAFDEAPPAAVALEAQAPASVVVPTDDGTTESGEVSASGAEESPAARAETQATEESAASAPPSAPSAAAAKEENTQAAVEGVADEEAKAPPAAEEPEAHAVEAEEGTGGGDQDLEAEESEDEWGSDFGDFEEAPTTDEPEPVTSRASTAVPTGAVSAFPKPPVSAAGSLPAVGPAVGAGGAAAATVQGWAPGGTADKTSRDARVAVDGGVRASPLAAMVAVFDGAFGEAAAAAATAGETVVSWRAPSVSSGAVEGGSSLDSLADLAHLLAHAKPSRRCAPARLSKWARSCILRGIRPVPDALSLQEDGEFDQDTGHRGRGRVSVSVRFEAQQSSTPAAPSPGGSPAVEAPQPAAAAAAAAAERPASSSPLASSAGLARSSSAKTSPRAMSPSSALRPLPRKASETVEPSPPPPPPPLPSRTGAVASPPAVLGQRASAKITASRVMSPSSSLPPLQQKTFAAVESLPTELEAGQQPQPADASSDTGKGATVVGGQAGLEAKATAATTTVTATPAVVESEGTRGHAAFPASPKQPAGEKAPFEEDEFVWSEAAAITPEMPRHPPPRVPTTPPGVRGESRGFDDKEGGNVGVRASASGSIDNGDEGVAVAGGVDSAANAEVDAGGGGGDDDDDWSDDPFDSFQSAPPASSLAPPLHPSSVLEGPSTTAAALERTSSPSPPVEASPWNLDFLMAAPAMGGAGDGRVSPAPSAGFGAGVLSAGEEGQSGKPLDLVSQALAGFGIAASAAPDASQAKRGDDVFSALSEGGGATGGISSGGDGGLKGEKDRVSSVDVSDLLRATRLRGGGRRASRPAETLSAAAEARLSALPDLSYMLSQRIRFPMRVAEPLPATATGEGFL